jgi:integrase
MLQKLTVPLPKTVPLPPRIANQKQIALAPPGRHKVEGEKGLYLHVSPNEVRRWIFRFTVLTVARTGEVLGMQWDEIDWDKRLWAVPKERMKTAREHQVPLCERAIEILKLQQQYSSGSGYVFEGYNRTRLADRSLIPILKLMDRCRPSRGARLT